MTPLSRNGRIRFILIAGQALFCLLAARLFQIQWAQSDQFDARSRQHQTALTDKVKRGAVLDRRYRELALTKSVYSIGVYPGWCRDLITRAKKDSEFVETRKRAFAELLVRHTDLDAEKAMRLLSSSRGFEWAQRRVEFSVILALEEDMKANGADWWPRSPLQYEVEERRFYPRGSLAAHAIGYTNIDGEGMEGVELAYEERLRSRLVKRTAQKDGIGRVIDPMALGAETPARSESVVMTIDEKIQYVLEAE